MIRAVCAFPDRASALRLAAEVALQVTAIWSDHRYLDMTEMMSAAQNAERAA